MLIGIYLRELWRHKLGMALSALIAAVAMVQVVWGLSLAPPGIGSNSIDLASASTHVIVGTPRSSAVDPRVDAYTLESLSNRALILGNVMASLPVRQYIAHRVGVPVEKIRVEPPLTPEQPRAMADSDHAAHISDIFKSPDEYRLSVQADPMAPVLDIYAVAPSATGATKLATASVNGLRDYLGSVAAKERTPRLDQVRLEVLGSSEAGLIDGGSGFQFAILTFVIVFTIGCFACLVISRIRRGWSVAANAGTDARSLHEVT
jgi:hypothetical protein